MSAREFKFGDPIPRPIDGRKCIFSRHVPETNPPAIELLYEDNGLNYLWMTEEELAPYLEPSAQPHVAAGMGWREKLDEALGGYEELCRPLPDPKADFERKRRLVEATGEIHALIAEVVELPALMEDFRQLWETADAVHRLWVTRTELDELRGAVEALRPKMEAALIRAATSGRDEEKP